MMSLDVFGQDFQGIVIKPVIAVQGKEIFSSGLSIAVISRSAPCACARQSECLCGDAIGILLFCAPFLAQFQGVVLGALYGKKHLEITESLCFQGSE